MSMNTNKIVLSISRPANIVSILPNCVTNSVARMIPINQGNICTAIASMFGYPNLGHQTGGGEVDKIMVTLVFIRSVKRPATNVQPRGGLL